jgi:hypothetical protein
MPAAYVSIDIMAGDVPSIAVVVDNVMSITKFTKNAEAKAEAQGDLASW